MGVRSATALAARVAEDDPPGWALGVVAASPLPVLILDNPSERILAASDPAVALLSAGGERPVVGATMAAVSYRIPAEPGERRPPDGLPGYQCTRLIHVHGRLIPFRLSMRPVEPRQPAGALFAVVAALEGPSDGTDHAGTGPAADAVVGSTDARLVIDRISSDVGVRLGLSPEQVLGASLLDLVAPSEISGLLAVLARATRCSSGGQARLWVRGRDGDALAALVVVVPLLPSPSCAFAVVPDTGRGTPGRGAELDTALRRLACSAGIVAASPGAASPAWMSRLSARELEVVHQLLAGDRVPAIARGLYLSQSTVRNYLSSTFRKFGVGSQQELLDLLRTSDWTPAGPR